MNTTSIGLRSETSHSSLNHIPDDGRLEEEPTPTPTPTPLSAESTPIEKETDDNSKHTKTKKTKNIPMELTAYGTTPSGKPRLFVCQICTRAFARLEHLRRHERSHTKEKPFSCGVCQRKFSRRDLLLRHAQKLHAGCTDAITRLRRKSIRLKEDEGEDEASPVAQDTTKIKAEPVEFNLNLFDSKANTTKAKVLKAKRNSSAFAQQPSLPTGATVTPASSTSSSANATRKSSNPANLKRQALEHNRHTPDLTGSTGIAITPTRARRGTSFSAQSGANYAVNIPEFSDVYPQSDNVEFSTPQFLPSSSADEMNWLDNLAHIPGLSDTSNIVKMQRTSSITSGINGYPTPPVNVSHHGSFSHPSTFTAMGQTRTDSVNSTNSQFDGGYMMPTVTLTSQEIQNGVNAHHQHQLQHQHQHQLQQQQQPPPLPQQQQQQQQQQPQQPQQQPPPPSQAQPQAQLQTFHHTGQLDKYLDGSGYSFYDIPDDVLDQALHMDPTSHIRVLTPILQEPDEDRVPGRTDEAVNPEWNFLNDIDELTHEIDVGAKFMPGGYSFYGDQFSASSSGVDASSPANLKSPPKANSSQLNVVNPVFENTIDQHTLLNLENATTPQRELFEQMPKMRLSNFSRNKMFTNHMRQLISRALNKYPISGISTPVIPSNEKLESFLYRFVGEFLAHFSFIHVSKLNEYEIMSMASDEDESNESARVCLPLLAATIGALLANCKSESEHLYEASRRAIHIYLESRKNPPQTKANDGGGSTKNPLWLIQSLTLSVIYGLFSDNPNNVFIVMRQLNALNSLVKTSIKTNEAILFSIHGEDRMIYDKLVESSKKQAEEVSLFSNTLSDELKFKNLINLQSQSRIVYIIYRLTNFLSMLYNVPLTLSANDLGELVVPNRNDEYLWSFKSYQDFQESCSMNGETLNMYSRTSTIQFKELLLRISKSASPSVPANEELDRSIAFSLDQLGKCGFTSLVHGIYEIKQYKEMAKIDAFKVLDEISVHFPMDGDKHKLQRDYEKIDYLLLSNYTKIVTALNMKFIKDQLWFKTFQDLVNNFDFAFTSFPSKGDENVDDDYLRVADCCIELIKLLSFGTIEIGGSNLHQQPQTGAKHSSEILGQDPFSTDFGYLDNTSNSFIDDHSFLHHENTNNNHGHSASQNTVKIQFSSQFEPTKDLVHAQMLFHAFNTMVLFSIYLIRRKSLLCKQGLLGDETHCESLKPLTTKLQLMVSVVDQIAAELNQHGYKHPGGDEFGGGGGSNAGIANPSSTTSPLQPGGGGGSSAHTSPQVKLEHGWSTLSYLTSGNPAAATVAVANDTLEPSIETTLHILDVGELMMSYLYESQLRVSILKKLAVNLLMMKRYVVENKDKLVD